jgi:hypothetical protein
LIDGLVDVNLSTQTYKEVGSNYLIMSNQTVLNSDIGRWFSVHTIV